MSDKEKVKTTGFFRLFRRPQDHASKAEKVLPSPFTVVVVNPDLIFSQVGQRAKEHAEGKPTQIYSSADYTDGQLGVSGLLICIHDHVEKKGVEYAIQGAFGNPITTSEDLDGRFTPAQFHTIKDALERRGFGVKTPKKRGNQMYVSDKRRTLDIFFGPPKKDDEAPVAERRNDNLQFFLNKKGEEFADSFPLERKQFPEDLESCANMIEAVILAIYEAKGVTPPQMVLHIKPETSEFLEQTSHS